MIDRVPSPGKSGRMLITPETGNPFYAIVTMADDPIDPGTDLNRQNLFSADAESKFKLTGNNATPNNGFIKTHQAISYLASFPWKKIAEYKTAGSFSYTVPANVYQIGVRAIGGGGGGFGGVSTLIRSGGASGRAINDIISVTPGQVISGVIGAGGAAAQAGGSTSFGSVIALGGSGGRSGQGAGVPGGQGSAAHNESDAPLGGVSATSVSTNYAASNTSWSSWSAANIFEGGKIELAAGATVSETTVQTQAVLRSGEYGGAGSSNGAGGAAAGHGNGGGAGTTGGAGSNGSVRIYIWGDTDIWR